MAVDLGQHERVLVGVVSHLDMDVKPTPLCQAHPDLVKGVGKLLDRATKIGKLDRWIDDELSPVVKTAVGLLTPAARQLWNSKLTRPVVVLQFEADESRAVVLNSWLIHVDTLYPLLKFVHNKNSRGG